MNTNFLCPGNKDMEYSATFMDNQGQEIMENVTILNQI